MPGTEVCFYADKDGSCPFLLWLEGQDERVKVKMLERISRLRSVGFKLGPPLAKPLGNGINELRVRCGRAQYRALYFFDRSRAVIAHGFAKRGKKVPAIEVERCLGRRHAFEGDPAAHIYTVKE